MEELRQALEGRLSVFTGPSGVGKTSLLNVLQPGLGRMVKAISRRREEGIHTTRDSELVRLGPDTWLADTPGIRSLNLWDIEPEELDAWYVDIAPLVEDCRFGDCAHRDEPGCAVRRAVAGGELSERRWRSFRQLYDELEAQYGCDAPGFQAPTTSPPFSSSSSSNRTSLAISMKRTPFRWSSSCWKTRASQPPARRRRALPCRPGP